MKNEPDDLPLRLLTAAVRGMPPARAAWGQAMLAELAYVHGSAARWRFALSCVPVSLFPPPGGAAMLIRENPASTLSTFALALVISGVLVTPLVWLELRHTALTSRRVSDYAALFGLLWLLAMVFVMTATPLVRAIRSGEGVLQNPFAVGLKVALLLAAAMTWLSIVGDQLPCFMGSPNCD